MLIFVYFSAGASNLYAVGHPQVRQGGVQPRCPIHRRLLRIRTLSRQSHRRRAGDGEGKVPGGFREARPLGRGPQDAHETLGQS